MSEYEKGCVNVSAYEKLERENAELKAKLAKGQESFELVLDNTVSDKATINLLRDALGALVKEIDHSYHNNESVLIYSGTLDEYRALAKQHKQG